MIKVAKSEHLDFYSFTDKRTGPFCQEKLRYDVYKSTFHHFVNDKSDTNTTIVG